MFASIAAPATPPTAPPSLLHSILAHVISALPWRRLQVSRRLEAVRGTCTAAKLEQKGVFKYLRWEHHRALLLLRREEQRLQGAHLENHLHFIADTDTTPEMHFVHLKKKKKVT